VYACTSETYFTGAGKDDETMTGALAIVLALAASVGWGAADFFGGAASRRTSVFVIVAVTEAVGLVAITPVLIVLGAPSGLDPGLLLAAVAGLGVTIELSLIYVALSRGAGFITAPVGALGTAMAVAVGLLGGDPIDLTLALGLLCAIVGGGLSAITPGDEEDRSSSSRRTVAICLGAAAGVAIMLISLRAAGRADPYWATAIEHASTALSAGLLAALSFRGRRRPAVSPLAGSSALSRGQLPLIALAAVTGVGGDVAYASASRHGALSLVSSISSLYALTTIALGVVIQRRRAGPIQAAGVALALTGAAVLGAAAH
jgi:drug/metabolite transporter (DMT)-like permease